MSKDREEKPQGKEKRNEEPSISASIQPSVPPAPERRTNPSPPPTEREREDAEGKTEEVKEVQVELLEEEKETQPVERVQKRGEEEADEGKQDENDVVEIMHVVASDEEQKGEAKELVRGSLLSPSVSSPPARPLRDIDSIVDKHLGDFSSEIQLLLQEESVHYSFPQSPHSTSNTETTAIQYTLPHTPISQFSQYVSFYNPCPPVQDYVSSLQDSINSMLTEFDDSWTSHKPATSRTHADAALASRVSDFVSSIRAANTKTDDDGLCGEPTAADVCAAVSQSPALSRGGEMRQPHTITKQFPDATNNRNPPTAHVTLPGTTSAPGSVYKPTNTAALHPPPNKSPQSHWKPQQSHTSEINRTVAHSIRQTQDNSTSRTESLHSSEPASSPASVSIPSPGACPAPPAAALSSLISRLQPEVFNSLVKIIKDVKKNSLQFYLHGTHDQDQDQVHQVIKVSSWPNT